MKFAHLADCHLGSWRQKEMQELNLESFNFALDYCIKEKVNFVLIAGDLFDTAIPNIDILKEATGKLKELNNAEIACYVVPGSHDYSVSGKSMIHVLEKAGLLTDVTFPVEKKDYYIAGLGGERNGLETKKIGEIKNIESDKFKILMLHTTLGEMNLPFMESIQIKDLPKGFDYYALGHIHDKRIFENGKSKLAYPGALFPCNFLELEQFQFGSFLIVESENKDIREIPIKLREVLSLDIGADNETSQSLCDKIREQINKSNVKDKIITIKVSGVLVSGKPSEIDFKAIEQEITKAGGYCVLRNTSKLTTKEFELADKALGEMKVDMTNIKHLESEIVKEMIKQNIVNEGEEKRVLQFMESFDTEKIEGETKDSFSSRLFDETTRKLNLDFLNENRENED